MVTSDVDSTTERIRSEALALFVERGYGTTTIEHISSAAGVGVATIYRRYADKAAIANDLYVEGIEAMADMLAIDGPGEPSAVFMAMWRRLWEWGSERRSLFLFVNASVGSPWLSEENRQRKQHMLDTEQELYARLAITASPALAQAMIGGTLVAVLGSDSDVDPDEIGERLWCALTVGSG